MWWCSYASESACLIVVVHTLRYLVLQPTNVRPVLCYVCVRTLTLRLNIMACITPGLHMGTAMHVCAHARLWQRLCCDTMYPHVLCVCVLVCAPFPCHAPFYRTLHTPSSMHPYHPPTCRGGQGGADVFGQTRHARRSEQYGWLVVVGMCGCG